MDLPPSERSKPSGGSDAPAAPASPIRARAPERAASWSITLALLGFLAFLPAGFPRPPLGPWGHWSLAIACFGLGLVLAWIATPGKARSWGIALNALLLLVFLQLVIPYAGPPFGGFSVGGL